MRINAFSAACLVAGGILALGQPSAGWAQGTSTRDTATKRTATNDTATATFTIAGEIGAREYTKQPDPRARGKFEEYRDMRTGPLLEQALLRYTPADNFGVYSVSVRRLFDRDQSAWLQAMRPGNYDFQVRLDRIPHTYSTTARSPGFENVPGFNTLPVPRPDSLAWRNAPYLSAVRSQTDPMKVSLGLTPTEKLNLKGEYLRVTSNGGIPRSLSYNASSGPTREFIAPIDQTMNDFRFSPGFASGVRAENNALSFIKSYQLMATYAHSQFHNAITSTMVDNPQLSVSSFTNGTASSRVSLPPSNDAQSLSLTGAVMFPVHTRLMGTYSSSWMSQNDPFLPQASNDSLKRDPNYALLTLPRTSLDGQVKTSVVNFSATSHPISKLALAARYRSYKREDQTAQFHIRAMAISDRSINLGDSLYTEADPFTKVNSDLSANYQLVQGLSLTAGYAMENWTRDSEVRNVGKTKEKGPRASLDYNGLEWLTLHTSYSTATRRGDAYAVATTEMIDFRRFDLADRDRKRTNILATVTPLENISLSFNYQIGDDQFPNSLYGTQSDKTTAKGFDVDWSPVSRFSLSGGYSMEDATNILKARYRTGAAGSVTFDNTSYRWTNTNTDKNRTAYASVTAVLIPDKLDFVGNMSNINAHFWVYNVNPLTPTGGTAAQNLSATVENWPKVTQNLKPAMLSLRYRHSADWAFTLRYQAEQYEQTDFRTSMPQFAPFTGQTGNLPGSIGTVAGSNTGQYHFLGNNYLPYTANWFTILISYHPSALPFSKARSTF
jgi:MtrB/PioB family decaheme-associated outer membrane protein